MNKGTDLKSAPLLILNFTTSDVFQFQGIICPTMVFYAGKIMPEDVIQKVSSR
jgi:hypothetical protein